MPRKSNKPDLSEESDSPNSIEVKTQRVNTNIPKGVFQTLCDWAKSENRSYGNLASMLLEIAIREGSERGIYPAQRLAELRQQQQHGFDEQDKDLSDLAITYARSIGLGLPMNIFDIQQLANKLGIPSDRLAQAINHKEENHHAKNHH